MSPQEFQEALSRPRLERGTQLAKLYEEFISTAKHIGETIIRERSLPEECRTIRPLGGKGIAGGEKFQVNSIFFKVRVCTISPHIFM